MEIEGTAPDTGAAPDTVAGDTGIDLADSLASALNDLAPTEGESSLDPEPESGDASPAKPDADAVDEDVLGAFSDPDAQAPEGVEKTPEAPVETPKPESVPEDELAAFRAWKADQAAQAAKPAEQPVITEPVPLEITQEEYDNALLGENGLDTFRAMLGKAAAAGGANAILAARQEIAQAREAIAADIEKAREDLYNQSLKQLDWALSSYWAYRSNPEIRGHEKAFMVAYNKELAKGVDNETAADNAVVSFKSAYKQFQAIQKSGKRVDLRGAQQPGLRPAGGSWGGDGGNADENDPLIAGLNGLFMGGQS